MVGSERFGGMNVNFDRDGVLSGTPVESRDSAENQARNDFAEMHPELVGDPETFEAEFADFLRAYGHMYRIAELQTVQTE